MLLCTPTDLRALAIGFLVNEGFIATSGDIRYLDLRADGQGADIWLDHDPPEPALRIRTSGCTGGMTFHEAMANDFRLAPGPTLTPASVLAQMHALIGAGTLYRQARGVHTSALSDGETLLVVAEDVGRHNTLDKIAGLCQLQAIPTEGRILLTTGRVSSEMLYKAAHMGIPIVISRTSPTALTVRLARSWGMTLVGYAYSGSFTVYAGLERLEAGPHPQPLAHAAGEGSPLPHGATIEAAAATP